MQPAMHPRFLDTRDEKEEAIDDRLAEIASANKKYHEQEAEEKGASEDAAGSLHDEEPVVSMGQVRASRRVHFDQAPTYISCCPLQLIRFS